MRVWLLIDRGSEMSVGERIKMARRMAGLSMDDLATTAGVSKMAISKYERGINVPGTGVLIRLAQALDVKVAYFLYPVSVSLSPPVYRRRKSLRVKDQNAVLGRTQEWLERYLDVESLFGSPVEFTPPEINRRIARLDEVERAALELRQVWQLGLDPIENLVELLETRGIKVGMVDGPDEFDALTMWANGSLPVIVVKRNSPGDRQRLNLAHELGHLVLEPVEDVDEEKAAYRFAAAFLVPEPVARAELGDHRKTLDLYELHLLKHKYGLSMQAWVYRAKDLGIISSSVAASLFQKFRQENWHHQEPGDPIPPEEPGRMKRFVLRALAEDVISPSRAAELLGMPLTQFWHEEATHHDGFPLPVYC